MNRKYLETFSLWLAVAVVPVIASGAFARENVADLSAVKVQGNQLIANGKPIRFRGLDWGWWHLMGTRYSETDMRDAAGWGANVIRLSFSYNDLETDDTPAAWKPQGLKDLDEVVEWGHRYGVYVILDMHVVPGGQSTASYCAGGHNLIWKDAAYQQKFVDLWVEIAHRYRDNPVVAAYELVNEPGSQQKGPDLLRDIDQRAIHAIREVDSSKVIVVGGDRGSGPGDLVDAMKFSDTNILYTFHWYVGAGGNEDWLGTVKPTDAITASRERPITSDWQKIQETFTAPPDCDHLCALLRSSGNSGFAWFDDVEVTDASGKVLQSANFDQNPEGYTVESGSDRLSFDPSIGHDKPASLKLHNTIGENDFAGWAGKRVTVHAGNQYRISGWVKLEKATGETYIGAAFFRNDTRIDPATFQRRMVPAIEFSKKYNVPVWVGEFGCDASDPDLQVRWVDACISLFESNGLHWTYWNDRETSSPNGMGVHAEHRDGSDLPVNDRLLAALRSGWHRNAS